MTPQSHQRWSLAAWLRDWVSSDCQEGWRDSSQFPRRSWRRWFDYDHTIWLVFLGFWFIEPVPGPRAADASGSGCPSLSFSSFLLLAGASAARAELRWVWVLAMFVVAMVYVPINQTAWGIYIYIAVSHPGGV